MIDGNIIQSVEIYQVYNLLLVCSPYLSKICNTPIIFNCSVSDFYGAYNGVNCAFGLLELFDNIDRVCSLYNNTLDLYNSINNISDIDEINTAVRNVLYRYNSAGYDLGDFYINIKSMHRLGSDIGIVYDLTNHIVNFTSNSIYKCL
jgi:hypothetical protein